MGNEAESVHEPPLKKQKVVSQKHGGAIVQDGQNQKSLILNFRYHKNSILQELVKAQEEKELGIILQAFRYMVNNQFV